MESSRHSRERYQVAAHFDAGEALAAPRCFGVGFGVWGLGYRVESSGLSV